MIMRLIDADKMNLLLGISDRDIYAKLMGFPSGWSELEPSEMQSYRSRHTRSSARSRKN